MLGIDVEVGLAVGFRLELGIGWGLVRMGLVGIGWVGIVLIGVCRFWLNCTC